MDKCSCGKYFYHRATDFTPYQNLDNEPHGWYDENANEGNNFCPSCGDQLLPDGRVIQRESVPNRLMSMLREVQADCHESGLQEFALRVFNWIEQMREAAGVDKYVLGFTAGDSSMLDRLINEPENITLGELFRLLNAAKQEAKSGD